MIKQKITALVAAASLTLGIFGGALAQPVKAQTREDASIIIKFCATAHRAFMRGDKGALLSRGMAALESDANRAVVALACAAYGVGYQTGERNLT